MATRAVLVSVLVSLAACSGNGDKFDLVIDVSSDGIGFCDGCNPLTQTGCCAGQKCTWINDQDDPPIGHVGCAPEGGVGGTPIAIGGACADPVAGPTGYDDCAKGTACLSGECKQICDVNGGVPTCDENHACTRYADFFESGGTAVAGVCDPGCDPLTQDLAIGTTTAACGSSEPSMPNKGCYGYDEYSCAPAGSASWPLTDRMAPRTNNAGNPYLNGCAPGFIPLFYERTGSTVVKCTGFCAALETDNTGPHATNGKGDTTALGKLPMDSVAVAGHSTCDITAKGSRDSSRCRFMYPYLEDEATGELPVAFEMNYVDTLGVCMAIEFFQWDSNGSGAIDTNDARYPDCKDLVPTGGASDELNAWAWGCQKRSNVPQALTSGAKRGRLPVARDIRLPKQVEMQIVRHQLD